MLRSGSGSSTGRGAATSSIENVRYSFSALRSVTISSAARCRASSKSMIGAGCGGAAGCSSARRLDDRGRLRDRLGRARRWSDRLGPLADLGQRLLRHGRRCDVRRGRPRNLEHEELADRGLLRRGTGPHLPAQRVGREHMHADRDDERGAREREPHAVAGARRTPRVDRRVDDWFELAHRGSRCNADHYDWRGRRMVRRYGLVKRAAARAGANPSLARRHAPMRARALRRDAGR